MKSIPISVRLSQDEADFIAQISIPSAVTPSEKLRYIINQAREAVQDPETLEQARQQAHKLIATLLAPVEESEHIYDKQSSILATHHYWLERSLAVLILYSGSVKKSPHILEAYEKKCLELMFNTTDQLQRMITPPYASCPNSEILKQIKHQLNSVTKQRNER